MNKDINKSTQTAAPLILCFLGALTCAAQASETTSSADTEQTISVVARAICTNPSTAFLHETSVDMMCEVTYEDSAGNCVIETINTSCQSNVTADSRQPASGNEQKSSAIITSFGELGVFCDITANAKSFNNDGTPIDTRSLSATYEKYMSGGEALGRTAVRVLDANTEGNSAHGFPELIYNVNPL